MPSRLFVISNEQLVTLYDCILDGNLLEFERVMETIKREQEIKVDERGTGKEDGRTIAGH